jgi:hypothetical protein
VTFAIEKLICTGQFQSAKADFALFVAAVSTALFCG